MEAVLTRWQQTPTLEPEEFDPRSFPQTTVRKVIKKCQENGTFDTTPFIDSRPLIDYVPQEVIKLHNPQSKRGRQTVRYTPGQKEHETLELLQLAGELHNHKILEELHQYFRAGNMKAFYATAERVMRVQ